MTVPEGFRALRSGRRFYAVREGMESGRLQLPVPDESGAGIERLAGGRGGVLRMRAAGEGVIVRAYRHGGAFGRFLGPIYLGCGRGIREIEALRRLEAAGVPAPRAVFLEWRPSLPLLTGGPGRLRLGTGELAGARALLEIFERAAPASVAVRRAALRAAGETIRRMHEAGIVHADLHAGNLLLLPGGSVAVLDLDRARILGGPAPARFRIGNLLRLRRSVRKRRESLLLSRADAMRLCRAAVPAGIVGKDALLRALARDACRNRVRSLLESTSRSRSVR